MEEDPDNKTLVYYFDEKGRLTAEKNQLMVNEDEYSSKREYDVVGEWGQACRYAFKNVIMYPQWLDHHV